MPSCCSTVLVWVAIIAAKLARLDRETAELATLARAALRDRDAPMAELLVWPALVAYGEAAIAYAGGLGVPLLSGRLVLSGRLGIWVCVSAGSRRRRC